MINRPLKNRRNVFNWGGDTASGWGLAKFQDKTLERNINLFNQITPDVLLSFRKISLVSDYCIRVRRGSDNQELDIGFTANGLVNEYALSVFCQGTTGYVSTWYDQSTSKRDATQSVQTRQPIIYESGATIKTNGRVAILVKSESSNSESTYLVTPIVGVNQLTATINLVATATTYMRFAALTNFANQLNFGVDEGSSERWSDALTYSQLCRTVRSSVSAGMPSSGGLIFTHINNGTNHIFRRNGIQGASVAVSGSLQSGNTKFVAGQIPFSQATRSAYLNEATLFLSELNSTNYSALERNQSEFFGISI